MSQYPRVWSAHEVVLALEAPDALDGADSSVPPRRGVPRSLHSG
ncbi:MAG: hypothetical protein AAGC55_23915 [Myxococcota bacterium]